MTGPLVDAVLFDLFGTLVPVDASVSWTARMAEPLGVPEDVFAAGFRATAQDRMTGRMTVPENIRKVCEAAGFEPSDEQVAASEQARHEVLLQWLRPRPVTMPALRRLHDDGVLLALVSDCSWDAVELWPTTPMAPLFQTAVLSAEMGTKKPDPAMYLTACTTLGVDPARCLYVGDGNSTELTGAAAVGLRAIHLDTERPEHPAPDYEGSTWTGERVATLTEILPLAGC